MKRYVSRTMKISIYKVRCIDEANQKFDTIEQSVLACISEDEKISIMKERCKDKGLVAYGFDLLRNDIFKVRMEEQKFYALSEKIFVDSVCSNNKDENKDEKEK